MIKGKTSNELLDGVEFEQKILLDKNNSDTNIYSKRLSLVTDDDFNNEDLQIVGIKVNFGTDGQYSITQEEKRKCKSADTLSALKDPMKLSNTSDRPNHVNSRGYTNKYSNVQYTDRAISAKAEDKSKLQDAIERSTVTPVLELKLRSKCVESKEFELLIKSKKQDADFFSDDESTEDSNDICNEIIQEHVANHKINLCKNELPCISHSNGNSSGQITPVLETVDMYSTASQTEKAVQSSSAQTTYVEVHLPKTFQEVAIQSIDRQRDVATATDVKKTKSVETETDATCNSSVYVQTDTEMITESSQTETAAVYTIDSTYDAATQTKQVKDRRTETDFNIYIVDREKVCDKDVDTQDLPYENLIVAREEEANAREDCRVHCFHVGKNQNENDRSCNTANETTQPPTSIYCMNQHPAHILLVASACNENRTYEHCAKCKGNTSDKSCCQTRIFHQECNKENRSSVENITQPKYLTVTEMEYASLGIREKANYTPQLQIVKGLGFLLKTIKAVQLKIRVKTEKVEVCKIPVVIQHFLVSFRLAVYRKPRAVINPINISLSASLDPASKPITEEQQNKGHSNVSSKVWKEEDSNLHLMIYDRVKTKYMTVSPIKSVVPDGSRICLCDSCYIRVKTAVQEPRHSGLSRDDERKLKLEDEFKKRLPPSALPKIERKNFDYTSKDPWKPLEETKDEFVKKKTEALDIFHLESRESVERVKMVDLNSACEIVNDHLLSLRMVDEDVLRKSAETLHKMWFEVAASKDSNVQEVSNYLRYFEEFSYNLLKTLIHSVDNNGNNVLHFAFANNRFDLAEELLRNGYAFDLLDRTNKMGNSPLMVCAVSQPRNDSDWSIIRSSFQMGDVNKASPKSGQTPLMNAASRGFCDMVKLLMELGADPNLTDKDGSTALMYAAEHGHEGCTKILIRSSKCDPAVKDKDGQSACSIALDNGHNNIAVLIHMQALEKKRMCKRHVWTNRERFKEDKFKYCAKL